MRNRIMAEAPSPNREHLERSLAESMARTLRHEIGDFLQKVYASVAILQGRLPAQWDLEREILSRLRQGAENCKRLIDAIQDFLCPIRVAQQPLDLASLLPLLATSCQAAFPGVQVMLDDGGPAPVVGDAERLTQVGRILVTNACEAMPQHVLIRLRTNAAHHRVEWSFHDDGPGVPAEFADRLFTPFATSRTGHAGLGLALAQKIVAAHQGQITAGNNPEGGFVATVVLPLGEKVLAANTASG
jgi:signal transduction histidine kinase